MAKAKKMPSGKWRIQPCYYDEKGKAHRTSFTENTKREAEFKAAEWIMKRREVSIPENITVGEAIDSFIDDRSAILSATTVRGYTQIRENRMQGIMEIKLKYLTNEDIQKAINSDAKKLAPKTIRNGYALLAETLEAYLPDFKLKVTLPEKVEYEAQIPEDDEFIRLVRDTDGTLMGVVILLAACAGLRRSEICGLHWDDLDVEHNVLRIHKAHVIDKKKKWIMKSTKTRASTRRTKIPEFVMTRILELPKECERIIPITPNAVTDRFIRLRNRLKIRIRLHDLRHYNASVMLALNVPDKYAMRRGGWSTPHTMKKVYQHTFKSKQEQVDETINNFFEDLVHKDQEDE